MKVFLLTTLALVAFAFNSILCRLALRGEEIDAASFTAIRLLSGAVTLSVLASLFSKTWNARKSGHWVSAFFLFAYAACFSFAYLGLSSGTGALILFGSVQMTMISIAIFRGERLSAIEWLGLVVAAGGLVYLLLPGLTAPPLTSSALMIVAGMVWGLYTLRGRGQGDPLADTTGNFIRSVPMVAVVTLIFLPNLNLSDRGVLLAVLSGAAASGVGYTIWYTALKHHTATRAAVLQLPVPMLTAILGIILLAETATARLWIASAVILGGLGLVIGFRSPNVQQMQK